MRVADFISGDNPRSQRAECVNAFAEAEHPRLHFAALDIASRDVIKDEIPANIIARLFRREVLAALLQHDCQFQLVVELLGQVFRVNHGLVVSDNRVHILEKDDPRQHRVGETCLGRLFMMLTEISRRVKELLRKDRRLQPDLGRPMKDGLAARGQNLTFVMERVIECLVRGFQAGIPSRKKLTHVGGYERVRQAVECAFALDLAQIKGAGQIEVHDSLVGCYSTNS